jgi:hypothetical protein
MRRAVRGRSAGELDLLAASLAEPDRMEFASLAPDRIEPLINVARSHGVEAWLAGTAPSAEGGWALLAEQRLRFIAARARARSALEHFGEIVDGVGCAWVAVKGQAVAEDLYPHPHLRHAVDIDTLVDPAGFEDVLRCLEDSGWRLLDQNWPLLERTRPGQLRLLSGSGSLIDLHWNLMNDPRLRRDFPMPTKQLLERGRRLPSGLPALDPIDQLVHLAVHGALSGGNKLLWLADVGFAARSVEDWSAVVGRAARAGAVPPLDLMLLRAHRWLGTPVRQKFRPESVRAEPLWQRACRMVDAASPLDSNPALPSLGRSFARSARGTVGRSSVELVRHGAAYARGVGRRDGASPLTDINNRASPLFVVDDAPARRRYLASVTAG